MATSGKLEAEVEIKSNADKFWTTIRDSSANLPMVLADSDTKVEVIEGDGKAVGSVRQITFGEGPELLKTSNQRIDAFDDATRTLTYSLIEGDVLKYYKNYKACFTVTPKGDGSLVKWALEYEKASQEVPEPNAIKEFATKIFLKFDDYIQNA